MNSESFQLVCEVEQLVQEILHNQTVPESKKQEILKQLLQLKYQLVVHPGDSVWPSFVTPEMKLKEQIYQQTVSAEQHGFSSHQIKQIAKEQHMPLTKLNSAIAKSKQCKDYAETQTYAMALKPSASIWTAQQWSKLKDSDKLHWLQHVQQVESVPPHLVKQVMTSLW